MKKIILSFSVVLAFFSCSQHKTNLQVFSPDKKIELKFIINKKSQAGYLIDFKNNRVIDTSFFGFNFVGEKPFGVDLDVISNTRSSFDETWETVWGEQRFIKNNYNEFKVELKEKIDNGRTCIVVFRLFDDGVGFRFVFPEQENLNDICYQTQSPFPC